METSWSGGELTLDYPDGTSVSGPTAPHGLVSRVLWPAQSVELLAPADGNVIRAGDRIRFDHREAWFSAAGDEITIECQGAFQPVDPCGSIRREVPGSGEIWVGYVARIRLLRTP